MEFFPPKLFCKKKKKKKTSPAGQLDAPSTSLPIKATLADRKKVVKTGSIFVGRGRDMGRSSAESRVRGMGSGSAGAGAVQGHSCWHGQGQG